MKTFRISWYCTDTKAVREVTMFFASYQAARAWIDDKPEAINIQIVEV